MSVALPTRFQVFPEKFSDQASKLGDLFSLSEGAPSFGSIPKDADLGGAQGREKAIREYYNSFGSADPSVSPVENTPIVREGS